MSVSEDARVIVEMWKSFDPQVKIWFKRDSDGSIGLIVEYCTHYYNYLCREFDYYMNILPFFGKNKWDPKKGTHCYSLTQVTETIPHINHKSHEETNRANKENRNALKTSRPDMENQRPLERICENCLQFKLDKCFVKGSQAACEDFQPSRRNWIGHEEILQSRLRGAY